MRTWRLGVFLWTPVCSIALAWATNPVAAQETRGAIEGVVKDATGGVLPGVTVTAKHVATRRPSAAVTDTTARTVSRPAAGPVHRDRDAVGLQPADDRQG